MDNNQNFKKLLCYNMVNNSKCMYKNKCMFAHTLEEQIKEPIRQYIYNMIYVWEDLSNVNINEDKNLFDELILLSKECKNCMCKKCPGGYNCKFGVCLRQNKICYNDIMYGKCYNMLIETSENGMIIYRCINGIHLTEKKLIPYNQRMLSELTNIETNFMFKHNAALNSKNNIISLYVNDNTIDLIKNIISNKLNKADVINNLITTNNSFFNIEPNFENNNDDDDIFNDIMNEYKNINYDLNTNLNLNNELNNNNIEKCNLTNNIIIYDDV